MRNKDINDVIVCAFLDIAHVLYALEIDMDTYSIDCKALKDTLNALQEAHPETLEHPYLEAQMREED